MAEQITLSNVANLQDTTTAQTTINNNNAVIVKAFQDVLSRSGIAPNQMTTVLDMNSNPVINVGAPTSADSAVRLQDLTNLATGGVINYYNLSLYSSRAVAASSTIPSDILFIITGGYTTAGDGGSAKYFKYTGSTPGGFQSQDGAWWALNENVVNPMMFGANNQNQSGIDSSAAFQDCIDYTSFLHGTLSDKGGRMTIPAGHYYFGTGLNISNVDVGCVIEGAGKDCVFMYATADINLFTVAGPSKLSGMFLSGYNNVSSTGNVILVTSTGSNSTFTDLITNYSNSGIQVDGGNTKLHRVSIAYTFSAGLHALNTTNSIDCDFDTDWSAGQPAHGTTISAWQAGHNYTVGTVVTISSTYYIQCIAITGAGTSGGSAPTVVGYAPLTIIDNEVTWQLSCTSSTFGAHIDANTSSSAFQCEFTNCDFSVAAQHGVIIDQAGGGSTPPYISNFVECSFAGCLQSCIFLSSGAFAMINSCQFSGCTNSGSSSLVFGSSFVGDSCVSNNCFFGASPVAMEATYGINIEGGVNINIVGNSIGPQETAGISVAANVGNFNIIGNSIYGTPTGIVVNSGTSDYYNIVNNIYNTCTTGLSDNGSGSNKTVSPNH